MNPALVTDLKESIPKVSTMFEEFSAVPVQQALDVFEDDLPDGRTHTLGRLLEECPDVYVR